MNLQDIPPLYETANDPQALPADRETAARYLLENADEIVSRYLDQHPLWKTYEMLCGRNGMDAVATDQYKNGFIVMDWTSVPAESDKVGNVVFGMARDARMIAERKKLVAA
jgi:hypothetical protein